MSNQQWNRHPNPYDQNFSRTDTGSSNFNRGVPPQQSSARFSNYNNGPNNYDNRPINANPYGNVHPAYRNEAGNYGINHRPMFDTNLGMPRYETHRQMSQGPPRFGYNSPNSQPEFLSPGQWARPPRNSFKHNQRQGSFNPRPKV